MVQNKPEIRARGARGIVGVSINPLMKGGDPLSTDYIKRIQGASGAVAF